MKNLYFQTVVWLKTKNQMFSDWLDAQYMKFYFWFEDKILWPMGFISFGLWILSSIVLILTLVFGGLLMLGIWMFNPTILFHAQGIWGITMLTEVIFLAFSFALSMGMSDYFDRKNGMIP